MSKSCKVGFKQDETFLPTFSWRQSFKVNLPNWIRLAVTPMVLVGWKFAYFDCQSFSLLQLMACPCFSALLSMDFEPTVSRIVGQCGSNISGSTHDIFTSNSFYPLAILHSEIICKYLVLLKHTETVKTINSKARSRKAWIKSVEESNQHDLQKRNTLRFFFHFDRVIEEIHSISSPHLCVPKPWSFYWRWHN